MSLNSNNKIIYYITVVVLSAALLAPSFVKLAHDFDDHRHDVCKTPQSTSHYHELNWECEFYKFKLSEQYSFSVLNFDLVQYTFEIEYLHSQYQLDYSSNHFSNKLRGPPCLI